MRAGLGYESGKRNRHEASPFRAVILLLVPLAKDGVWRRAKTGLLSAPIKITIVNRHGGPLGTGLVRFYDARPKGGTPEANQRSVP